MGAGPAVGLLTDITERWAFICRRARFATASVTITGARELVLEQRYVLGRQSALRLNLSRKQEFRDYWNSGQLSLYFYF